MNDFEGLAGRALTSLAFVLGALCFFLPFVTAGCDERTTAQGIDFVTGTAPPVLDEHGDEVEREDDEDEHLGEFVIEQGAPAATIALAFALVGAAVVLLAGTVAAAAAFLAGLVALAALALFLLGADLRPESIFIDLRAGFWLAALLTACGTAAAWRRLSADALRPHIDVAGARLVLLGALLLGASLITPHAWANRDEGGSDREPLVFLYLFSLTPGRRDTGAWGAAALLGLTFCVSLAAIMLTRSASARRPAGALVGLGLGGLLLASASAAWSITLDGQSVGDGAWIMASGSVLTLTGGVLALRDRGARAARVPSAARALVVAGVVTTLTASLLAFDRGVGDSPARALLRPDADVDLWFALAPPTLAAVALLAALRLDRDAGAGLLLGTGAGVAAAFLPLFYPVFASADDRAQLGAGAPAGLAGAALILLAGALSLRESSPAAPTP